MLVLSRQVHEQIQIGDDITITVVRLSRNAVRLGIEAPKEMTVLRTELDKLEPEARESALATTEPSE